MVRELSGVGRHRSRQALQRGAAPGVGALRRRLGGRRLGRGLLDGRLAAEPAGVLANALSTPWLLTLAVASLRRRGRAAADELAAAGDLESVQDHLFASLIPTAVAGLPRQRTSRRYTQDQVHGWLHNLARHLETRREQTRGGTDIALHELWEMVGNRTTRCLYGASVGLAVGLVSGLGFGLAGFPGGLEFGLLFGVVVGLRFWLARSMAPKQMSWRTHRKGGLRRRFAAGLVVGLTIGLPLGLLFVLVDFVRGLERVLEGGLVGLVAGITAGLLVGLMFGLMFALPLGLVIGLVAHDEPALSERRIIRDDALAGPAAGLTVGLTAVGLVVVSSAALKPMLAIGFASGLAVGLAVAGAAARYACATLVFAFRKSFPARPARFLVR